MVHLLSIQIVWLVCLLCTHCAPIVLEDMWPSSDPSPRRPLDGPNKSCLEGGLSNACSVIGTVCHNGICRAQGCTWYCECFDGYEGKYCDSRIGSSNGNGHGNGNGNGHTNGNGNGNGNGKGQIIDDFGNFDFLDQALKVTTKGTTTSTTGTTSSQTSTPTTTTSTTAETTVTTTEVTTQTTMTEVTTQTTSTEVTTETSTTSTNSETTTEDVSVGMTTESVTTPTSAENATVPVTHDITTESSVAIASETSTEYTNSSSDPVGIISQAAATVNKDTASGQSSIPVAPVSSNVSSSNADSVATDQGPQMTISGEQNTPAPYDNADNSTTASNSTTDATDVTSASSSSTTEQKAGAPNNQNQETTNDLTSSTSTSGSTDQIILNHPVGDFLPAASTSEASSTSVEYSTSVESTESTTEVTTSPFTADPHTGDTTETPTGTAMSTMSKLTKPSTRSQVKQSSMPNVSEPIKNTTNVPQTTMETKVKARGLSTNSETLTTTVSTPTATPTSITASSTFNESTIQSSTIELSTTSSSTTTKATTARSQDTFPILPPVVPNMQALLMNPMFLPTGSLPAGPSAQSGGQSGFSGTNVGHFPNGDNGHSSNGDNGHSSNGDNGHSSNGDNGHSSNGDNGHSSNGDNGHSSNGDSGDNGHGDNGHFVKKNGDNGHSFSGDNGHSFVNDNGHSSHGRSNDNGNGYDGNGNDNGNGANGNGNDNGHDSNGNGHDNGHSSNGNDNGHKSNYNFMDLGLGLVPNPQGSGNGDSTPSTANARTTRTVPSNGGPHPNDNVQKNDRDSDEYSQSQGASVARVDSFAGGYPEWMEHGRDIRDLMHQSKPVTREQQNISPLAVAAVPDTHSPDTQGQSGNATTLLGVIGQSQMNWRNPEDVSSKSHARKNETSDRFYDKGNDPSPVKSDKQPKDTANAKPKHSRTSLFFDDTKKYSGMPSRQLEYFEHQIRSLVSQASLPQLPPHFPLGNDEVEEFSRSHYPDIFKVSDRNSKKRRHYYLRPLISFVKDDSHHHDLGGT